MLAFIPFILCSYQQYKKNPEFWLLQILKECSIIYCLITECSIRVRMTALLEYIDLFLLNAQKGQIMLQISFKMPA